MTGLPLRVLTNGHRALCAQDLTGLHPWAGTRAMVRTISPFGGPKGYAHGLMIEMLVATLTRTARGDDVRGTLDPTDPPPRATSSSRWTRGRPGTTESGSPARACATRAANLADAVPVSQVAWTSAPHIAADVPERH